MSILMAALKQQHHSDPAPDKTSSYWRKLALVLALLLALLTGAVAAYLLSPLLHPVSAPTSEQTPEKPAAADVILQALQTKNVADNTSAPAADTVTASTSPADIGNALSQVVSPPPQPVSEQFSSPPPVKTMTAGTSAAEPKPIEVNKDVARDVAAEPVEVSSELRDKFASALKATEQSGRNPARRTNDAPAVDISELDISLRQQIPALRFDAHVYATTPSQRWVKVNGKTLQEGQWVTADIRIKEITPQFVLLQQGNQLFSMAALSAWPD